MTFPASVKRTGHSDDCDHARVGGGASTEKESIVQVAEGMGLISNLLHSKTLILKINHGTTFIRSRAAG